MATSISNTRNVLIFAESALFLQLQMRVATRGKSDGIKPIHISKVLNGNFILLKTVFQNMYASTNDVMSNMADFQSFWHKNANILRMAHPIMIYYIVIFILKSWSFEWWHSFMQSGRWKNVFCKGPPFEPSEKMRHYIKRENFQNLVVESFYFFLFWNHTIL